MSGVERMYKDVKTWSPFVGCYHDCIYCKPSFQRQMKRRRKWCNLCYNYEPHFHPERLNRIPNVKTIFACAFGDIAFAQSNWIRQIFEAIRKYKDKTFYIQTKDPSIFKSEIFFETPENVKLGVTLESDLLYYATPSRFKKYFEISQALNPETRLEIMFKVKDLINYVTIEPVLDFSNEFSSKLEELPLEFIYLGYDNHNCKLPEPSVNKTLKLKEELEKFTEVRLKTVRKAWWE